MTDNKLDKIFNEMVFAGISPDTLSPLYIEKKERHATAGFEDALRLADLFGENRRLPSEKELLMIMKNKSLSSTFSKEKEYLTSDIEGKEVSVVKIEAAHSYRKPAEGNYGMRFVSDKPSKIRML